LTNVVAKRAPTPTSSNARQPVRNNNGEKRTIIADAAINHKAFDPKICGKTKLGTMLSWIAHNRATALPNLLAHQLRYKTNLISRSSQTRLIL
jgi:hypothetical protein